VSLQYEGATILLRLRLSGRIVTKVDHDGAVCIWPLSVPVVDMKICCCVKFDLNISSTVPKSRVSLRMEVECVTS